MFDNNVYLDNSTTNYCIGQEVAGIEVKTNITYYRGIPCSMVHDVQVHIDGEQIPREDILFSVDGKDFFTLNELETVTTYRWEYGDPAIIRAKKSGGLTGKHEIRLVVGVRVAYVPVPFLGEKTRVVNF